MLRLALTVKKKSLPSTQHWWCQTWNSVLSYGIPRTRGMDTLERAQWRAAEVTVLEHLPCEGRLRAACSAWRGLRGNLINACKYLEGDAKKAEPGSFQCAQSRGNRHKMKDRRFCLSIRKVFALWGRSGTASGCPGRWWALPPCGYTRAVWTWSWASGSGWPCLAREVEGGDIQRPLPVSTILGFGDPPSCGVCVPRAGACLGVWALTSAGTTRGNEMCSGLSALPGTKQCSLLHSVEINSVPSKIRWFHLFYLIGPWFLLS